MNIERGIAQRILVPGRDLADSYVLRFTSRTDDGVKECTVQNEGNDTGPLLLAFTETDTPTDLDDVSLLVGDHFLQVLVAEGSIGGDFSDDFNADFSTTIDGVIYRELWREQVRVN